MLAAKCMPFFQFRNAVDPTLSYNRFKLRFPLDGCAIERNHLDILFILRIQVKSGNISGKLFVPSILLVILSIEQNRWG
jgi:hypothetical protein